MKKRGPSSSSRPPNGIATALGIVQEMPQHQPPPTVASPTVIDISGAPYSPPRICLLAVEGWGKTTFGAYSRNPVVVMSPGETGLLTRHQSGLVPDVRATQPATWSETLAVLSALKDTDHQTVVIDALGGFERLCHEFVCARDFGGVWGEKGFTGFMRGYDVSLADWAQFQVALDALRATGKAIILLAHAQVKPHRNPMGPDYDRYVADVHHKTWSLTGKWGDAVLFGQYRTQIVDQDRTGRAKAIAGDTRILYTEGRDAFTAKSRYDMPAAIELDASVPAADMFDYIWQYIEPQKYITEGEDK